MPGCSRCATEPGYAASERYADALVVSTWPSRGIWIAGVEVKVSRSDWRSELVSPEKSAEIQQPGEGTMA